jgi:hypothetical protein
MKSFLKTILYIHFYTLVKILILIKKPYIVLVVWWENKSMFKEKLKKIGIERGFDLRIDEKPYNTWFGIVLTILDLPTAYSNFAKWILIYFYSWVKFFSSLISFPKYLFLEWWIDEEWEAWRFLFLLNPHVIVFSSLEYTLKDDYETLDIIEDEFVKLIEYLNMRSNWLEKMNIEWDINIILDQIKSWEKYFWIINWNYERLSHIWNKLIRKLEIS